MYKLFYKIVHRKICVNLPRAIQSKSLGTTHFFCGGALVLDNNNIGIKKCTTFLWVLNFGEVGEILENFQKHPLGEIFLKIFSKV